MAELKELVDILSRGGPAESAKAAMGGFESGRAEGLEARRAAFQRKLQEAGLISGGEANKLAGTEVFDPTRTLTDDIVGSLTNLNTSSKPKVKEGPTALDLEEQQSRIDKNKATAAGSKRAREQADERLKATLGQPARAAKLSALKAAQEARAVAPNLSASLVSIREAAKALPKFSPGVVNQFLGKGKMAIKKFAKDPATETYLGIVAQNLSPLARGIAQEKGPLTDKDVDRIMQGLGDLTTPPATREKLLVELEDKIKRTIEAREKEVSTAAKDAETGLKNAPAVQKSLAEMSLEELQAELAQAELENQ